MPNFLQPIFLLKEYYNTVQEIPIYRNSCDLYLLNLVLNMAENYALYLFNLLINVAIKVFTGTNNTGETLLI